MQTSLNLILPDLTISVPAMKISPRLPITLEFQRLVSYENLEKDLKPLLYGTIGNSRGEVNHWFIQTFEENLAEKICSYSMFEMFDIDNSDSVYLLASSSDPCCLGPLIPSGCLGIFRYSISQISDLEGYLLDVKMVRSTLYKELVNIKDADKFSAKEKEECVERIKNTEELNKSLREYLKNARKSHELLVSQRERMKKRAFEIQNMMCVLCENARKNAVMLPCGHIYACTACLGRIPVGKKLTKPKRFPCILCRGQVCEVRIVNFS